MSSESDAWFKVVFNGTKGALAPKWIRRDEVVKDITTIRGNPELWWVVIDEPDAFVAIPAPGRFVAAFAYVKKT